jgi:hypothetical protein
MEMDAFFAELETELGNTMQQISVAAVKGDLQTVERETRKAAELTALRSQYEAIRSRVRTLKIGFQPISAFSRQPGTMRELAVHVTEGMKRQNYLALSEHIKRGLVRVGDRLNIETLPSHDRFETDIVPNGKRLRERGRIAKFYRDAGVGVGDTVLLSEVTPGQWQLVKRSK